MRFRILLAPALLLLAIAVSAQPATNTTDAKGRKQGAWSKPWPNGQPRYIGQFIDDKPTGEFKHFDEKGRLTSKQMHAGDGRVSRAEHYHPNGAVMARGKYIGQQKDSTWNYYAEDGGLRKVERFADGKLNGEQVTYYPTGQVAEREERRAGELHGPSKSWFANGKLKSEANYVKGEAEGRMTFYHPNGNKEIEGDVVNGVRDGTWYYFNADGTIQLQVLYAKGQVVKERKENGTFTEYFDDERPRSEVTFKKGKREGKFIEWHDNGKWVVKASKPDEAKGLPSDMERVLEGQTKKREGTYVNDQLDGEVRVYDEKGKLVKTIKYKAGVEQ
ncbi:MAG TPA: toxin-antitoxin system YwqK family antitoxin [Flavobacteriales bacterium]|nr:toxin-antitoxin system YwqK family antitoxin [Flavobacteriales bacterium]